MEDRTTETGNKAVVTSPSVEFLLKQVYLAYKEKIKGLESEIQHLKSELELHKQNNGHEDCKQCKVLSEELKKCKENYLESLSDQKYRIELLEMQLLSMQQVPVSKSEMSFLSETKEKSPCEMTMDESTSKKRKNSDELQFLYPAKVAKQKCSLLAKVAQSEKENSESHNLQPLSSIIVPETLDIDVNDDITVLGIYDKQAKGKKSAKIAMATTVPESIDIDVLEAVEPEIDDAAHLANDIIGVTPKHCNETRNDCDEHNINSPSLLPHIAVLLGKPEHKVERNKDADNYGGEQGNSRIMPPLKHLGEKCESDMVKVSSDANVAVIRNVTSPSLICPPEKKSKLCGLDIIQSNEHKANSNLCSSVSSFGDRGFLHKSEDLLEDMDETYFPLPLTSRHTVTQIGKCEDDENDDNEVIDIDDGHSDVLIIEEKHVPENECSTELEEHKNHLVVNMNNPAVECSFDRVPKKDADIKYKFREEPIRKKEERTRLLGHPCKQCEEYYNQLDISENEKGKRITKCSRHRAVHKPPATPEHYWELDFPDTPECKARGYMNETQKIQLQSRRRRPLVLRKDK